MLSFVFKSDLEMTSSDEFIMKYAESSFSKNHKVGYENRLRHNQKCWIINK